MSEIKDTIEAAAKRAGGIRALSRELNWDAASIVKARDEEKVSPYRAAQLASYLGTDIDRAVIEALLDTAKSAAEADFWRTRLQDSRSQLVSLAGDVLGFLEERWATYAHEPSVERKVSTFMSVMLERLGRKSTELKTAPRKAS